MTTPERATSAVPVALPDTTRADLAAHLSHAIQHLAAAGDEIDHATALATFGRSRLDMAAAILGDTLDAITTLLGEL